MLNDPNDRVGRRENETPFHSRKSEATVTARPKTSQISARSRRKRLGRPGCVLIALTIGVAVLVAAQLATYLTEVRSWASDPDVDALNATCGTCHPSTRAHRYAKSNAEWRRTVDRMLAKDPALAAGVDARTRERIVAVLTRRRTPSGEALFAVRCDRCHAGSVVDPYLSLDAEALTLLLRQHVRQKNFAIQTWEGERVIDAVLKRRRDIGTVDPPGDAGARQRLFQRACGTCHTARFLYGEMCDPPQDAGEWESVVVRMREKSPSLFDAEEAGVLTAASIEACADGRSGGE